MRNQSWDPDGSLLVDEELYRDGDVIKVLDHLTDIVRDAIEKEQATYRQVEIANQFNEAHVAGLQAYSNWGRLNLAQKDAVLKNLLGWALWKDGWL